MPLDRFVLILVCVIAAAGVTVWLAALVAAAFQVPVVATVLVPIVLAAYVLWRVIAERVGNKEEDHYDRMDH